MNEGEAAEEPHARLSDREMQVFMRLVEGKSVNQVADELHISCKTVSTHKTRLMHQGIVMLNRPPDRKRRGFYTAADANPLLA